MKTCSSRRSLILVALLLGLLVAGCGSHSVTHSVTQVTTTATHTSTATSTTTSVTGPPTSQLRCPPGDLTMQCVLATQPPPPAKGLPTGTPSTYGIDFGWSSVSASGAHAIGAKFGASYLSLDSTKNWTRADVDAYHSLGLKTVAVWETSSERALGTFADGESDARTARAQATALGMPTDRVIEFAIDCDCTPSGLVSYFSGVKAVLGLARESGYGGYDQLAYLFQHHLIGPEAWQTYAWSSGRWLPDTVAPLEQYLNGNAFDNDRALSALYGQWPAQVTPTVSPHYDWLPNIRRTFKIKAYSPAWGAPRTVHARERSSIRWLDGHHCNPGKKSGTFVRRGCVEHAEHARLLAGRLYSLAHHTPNHKRRVKHPRWGAPHYRVKGHTTTLGGGYRQERRRLVYHAKPITDWNP